MEAYAFRLDGDAALALEVHGVKNLFVHFALRQRAGHFEQAVSERGFAVVDVRDDAEVSNELRVHFSRLPIFSIAGRMRTVRTIFRRACCIRTSDTRSAKTVPYKHSVCHNSKAASACTPITCTPITGEKKSGVTRTEPGNCGSFLAEPRVT